MKKRISRRVEHISFQMDDGVLLAATLFLPESDIRVPALLEALPYRKDDMLEHREEYVRLCDEFGYAVCRVDLRGTGSSQGIATDEYPTVERSDLSAVIAELAASDWCNGKVGMFGTSYSGFNSLQLAAVRPPGLKAIVPIYSSDDPYTDDVHYSGGSMQLLDLVDYPIFMAANNTLPAVPGAIKDQTEQEWEAQWLERLDVEPWLLRWHEEQVYSQYWQERAIRPDYTRIDVPTMIIGGWADGYRNNSFRTFAALQESGTPCRLILGPWSHMGADKSLPGPWIDGVAEIARWFDRWLKEERNGIDSEDPIQLFVRQSTPPGPLNEKVNGYWRSEPAWPLERGESQVLPLGSGAQDYRVLPFVGVYAWNSCAGSLPWGAPEDQRFDDAASLTWEWPQSEPLEILGHAVLKIDVAADVPVAGLSVKLQDVFPDGSSTLISRGYLNLTHRGDVHSAPHPLVLGQYETVAVELNATSWELATGHTLRLSIAGTDWPHVIAPPEPVELSFKLDSASLTLPTVPKNDEFRPASVVEVERQAEPRDPSAVTWRITRDVLSQRTLATINHGNSWAASDGVPCSEQYWGEVAVNHTDFTQTADAVTSFEVDWGGATIKSESVLHFRADEEALDFEVIVRAWKNGELLKERSWPRRIERHLQ